MKKNPSFELNQFVKGASGCQCTGDGVFFIKLTGGVPTLTNVSGAVLSFKTSPFFKRFIKSMGVTADGVYGFRVIEGNVMFENILTCPTTFVASVAAKTFFFNTNNCAISNNGFYGIKVLGCNSVYTKVYDGTNCGLTAPTGITTNGYTCGDLVLSWLDVGGATSYDVTWISDILPSGCTSYLSFDGIDTNILVNDKLGGSYAVTNGVLGAGKISTGLVGNGTNTYASIGTQDFTNKSFSLSFWMYHTKALGASNYFLNQGVTQSIDTFLHIGRRNNNKMTFAFYGDDIDSIASIDNNRWYHIVLTYNTGNRKQSIYIDGVLDNTRTSTGQYTGTGPLYLMSNGFAGSAFQGSLDELASWKNKELSQEDVTLLYNNGNGIAYDIQGQLKVSSTTSLVNIPFRKDVAQTYTITPYGIAGAGPSSTKLVNIVQCAITGLSSNNYIHGTLTLTWNPSATAVNYSVTYGTTTTIVTSPTITIPFTAGGLVSYQVKGCNGGGCSIATSLGVIMMQSNVTGGTAGSYTCGDINLTWTPVVGATTYRTFFNGSFLDSTTAALTIPYSTPGTISFLIKAGNASGYNNGGTMSVAMNSCGISNLSSNGYTCGDLTLSWNAVPGATNYDIAYSGTVVNTTTTSKLITYANPGNVTYTVTARNGSTFISTANIDVVMKSCAVFYGNVYASAGQGQTRINGNTNYLDSLQNYSQLIEISQPGTMTGYSGSFAPIRITQSPYTKKLFYGLSNGIYTGSVGNKEVTLLAAGQRIEPSFAVNGVVYYGNTSSGYISAGTESSVGSVIWNNCGSFQCNLDGSKILIGLGRTVQIITSTGSLLYSYELDGNTGGTGFILFKPQVYGSNEIIFGYKSVDSTYNTTHLIQRHNLLSGSYTIINPSTSLVVQTICGSYGPIGQYPFYKDIKVYGDNIYYTIDANGHEQGAYSNQPQTGMINILTGAVTVLTTGSNAPIVWSNGGNDYRLSKGIFWGLETISSGYLSLYGRIGGNVAILRIYPNLSYEQGGITTGTSAYASNYCGGEGIIRYAKIFKV